MTPEEIKPFELPGVSKTEQVEEMFDAIASGYDMLNRAMTFGIDKLWRRKVVNLVASRHPEKILDVACGTADLTLMLARRIKDAHLLGIDLSEQMLRIGKRKIIDAGMEARVKLSKEDCLNLSLADEHFDAVTVAYGVRNFEQLEKGFTQMCRVLRKGGTLYVLELSVPSNKIVRPFYNFYTHHIIPAMGRLLSADARAYTYLPKSIAAMPKAEQIAAMMHRAGFSECSHIPLTLGVCSIYIGRK